MLKLYEKQYDDGLQTHAFVLLPRQCLLGFYYKFAGLVLLITPFSIFKLYLIHHYGIKFASNLRQVGGFLLTLRFLPRIIEVSNQ